MILDHNMDKFYEKAIFEYSFATFLKRVFVQKWLLFS